MRNDFVLEAIIIFTVYQRTPDVVISGVSECLQGHPTWSVFLDLLLIFVSYA